MAESGVAASAARRGTQKAVKGRLARVQQKLALRLSNQNPRSKAFKRSLARVGKATAAAENTLNARNALKR